MPHMQHASGVNVKHLYPASKGRTDTMSTCRADLRAVNLDVYGVSVGVANRLVFALSIESIEADEC